MTAVVAALHNEKAPVEAVSMIAKVRFHLWWLVAGGGRGGGGVHYPLSTDSGPSIMPLSHRTAPHCLHNCRTPRRITILAGENKYTPLDASCLVLLFHYTPILASATAF